MNCLSYARGIELTIVSLASVFADEAIGFAELVEQSSVIKWGASIRRSCGTEPSIIVSHRITIGIESNLAILRRWPRPAGFSEKTSMALVKEMLDKVESVAE